MAQLRTTQIPCWGGDAQYYNLLWIFKDQILLPWQEAVFWIPVMKCGTNFANNYSKNCEVGHPSTEPPNSYVIIHCHYSVIWPPVYRQSWPQLHISCYAFRVSPTSLCWPTWRVARFLYPIVHGPKFSFMSRTTCCPVNPHPFSTSLDNSSDKLPKALFTHRVK